MVYEDARPSYLTISFAAGAKIWWSPLLASMRTPFQVTKDSKICMRLEIGND